MSATVITVTETTVDPQAVTMAVDAAAKVEEYIAAALESGECESGAALRLGVRGGGCSGFKYVMSIDDESQDDIVFESEGQRILVSPECLPYISGSRIVWRSAGLTEGFDVENPNAVASCGCGSSFRIDPNAIGCSEPEGPPTSGDEVY
jgi:iron-sulfur cluster assembly protein